MGHTRQCREQSTHSSLVDQLDVQISDRGVKQLWIYEGTLHLVPLQYTSPPPPSRDTSDEQATEENVYISPSVAINLVRDPSVHTEAPEELARVVWSRISG
jgi:hypothetical protein